MYDDEGQNGEVDVSVDVSYGYSPWRYTFDAKQLKKDKSRSIGQQS